MIITKTGRYVSTFTILFFSLSILLPFSYLDVPSMSKIFNFYDYLIFRIWNQSIDFTSELKIGAILCCFLFLLLILINYLIGESINAISVNVRVHFCAHEKMRYQIWVNVCVCVRTGNVIWNRRAVGRARKRECGISENNYYNHDIIIKFNFSFLSVLQTMDAAAAVAAAAIIVADKNPFQIIVHTNWY